MEKPTNSVKIKSYGNGVYMDCTVWPQILACTSIMMCLVFLKSFKSTWMIFVNCPQVCGLEFMEKPTNSDKFISYGNGVYMDCTVWPQILAWTSIMMYLVFLQSFKAICMIVVNCPQVCGFGLMEKPTNSVKIKSYWNGVYMDWTVWPQSLACTSLMMF